MARKISEMANASALTGTELIEVVQSGGNYKLDVSTLQNYINSVELALPPLTANAGKVLVVNSTEDDVEWVDQVEEAMITSFSSGTIASSETIAYYVITTPMLIPTSATGSFAECLTAPTANAVFSIQKNAVEVGTITFAAAATDGTFAVAADINLIAGDNLRIVAPATADTTLESVAISLKATVV